MEVGGKLLRAVENFHKESKACVRMGRGEYFPVKVGLKLRCVMPPLFNIFMDGFGSGVIARVREQVAVMVYGGQRK